MKTTYPPNYSIAINRKIDQSVDEKRFSDSLSLIRQGKLLIHSTVMPSELATNVSHPAVNDTERMKFFTVLNQELLDKFRLITSNNY